MGTILQIRRPRKKEFKGTAQDCRATRVTEPIGWFVFPNLCVACFPLCRQRVTWVNPVKCIVYSLPTPKLHCQRRLQVHLIGEGWEAFLEEVTPAVSCFSCQHLYRPSSRWPCRCQIEKVYLFPSVKRAERDPGGNRKVPPQL